MKKPTYTPHTLAGVIITALLYLLLWAFVDHIDTPVAWWLFGASSTALPIQEAFRWGYREGLKEHTND